VPTETGLSLFGVLKQVMPRGACLAEDNLWSHYDVTMNRKTANAMARRKQSATRVPVTIRFPEDLLQEIDLELERRLVPASRNNWLLEAAIEKLRRTGSGGTNGTE
jgi:hypothetical protein